jgi:superfamily II DNA or RNA helicase
MIEAGLIDKVVIVAPRETIKNGFADDCEHVKMSPLLQLAGCETIRVDTDLRSNYVGGLSNVHVVIINYQSLNGLLGYFKLLAEAGKRLLFIFDEVHHGKASDDDDDDDDCAKAWGPAMEAVRQLACSIVCMTGTPVRTDGEDVPYLRYVTANYTNPKTMETVQARYVKADFTFSYRDAINAGVARKLIFRPQNPTVRFEFTKGGETIEYHGELSAVPRKLIERAKRELFRPGSGHIDDMLKLARWENELDRKIGDAEAAILVVVGPTDEKTGYNPLTHVALRIKALFGETAIAVESKDGEMARTSVRVFKRDSTRWIVSKDMITEGTSIPRIRTVLILRDIKSQVRFDQTVHRATRNRSDTVSQDAKVILFDLPLMMKFVAAIEDEIRMIIPKQRPTCPNPKCGRELEFYPRVGKPCPFCGYEPDPKPKPESGEFVWLGSEFGHESVQQGGEDFSPYDKITRVILGNLGPSSAFGGRHGLNEAFREAVKENLVNIADAKPKKSPWSPDEEMKRWWDAGLALCKSAAGKISRASGTDYQDALDGVIGQCKRAAGMGRDKKEKVMRDYPDPLATFKKFHDAADEAAKRTSGRYGSAA